jgi:hydrogenase maturation protein HypF
VYRLAAQMGLTGLVGNDSHGAFIEIQGPAGGIEQFKARLRNELPPLARIEDMRTEPIPLVTEARFRIETSATDGTQDAEITPDVATCADCRRELFDPADRRYRYPFINCTNCGPRYSIIQGVPYDRPKTTMSPFLMCPACQAEYGDPGNRRFHAQPNACPVCGPHVWLEEKDSTKTDRDPIGRCAELLRAGRIVAIKGLGGFHLACRADSDEAVATLRARKSRESKPLAVMVANLDAVRQIADIDESAAAAMTDVTRPIVLVPKQIDRLEGGPTPRISEHVAPGTDMLGVMLPYTPLHELLFAEGLGPMVMTSGNPTEEPLCCENEEALRRLSHIADAFLLHNRDIERRVDDSVVLSATEPGATGALSHAIVPIRRARGFAPGPIRVPVTANVPVLAVGAELKSTVCVLAGNTAIVSEHLGELANAKAYRNFVATVERFQQLLRIEPGAIAYDLHPEYAATRFALQYAKDRGLRPIGVQHHHAHVVGAMAENGLTGKVLGIACDGTGFGTDGAIWGCELLVSDETSFERAGHLRYFRLAGGDAAARETWRPAAGLLHDALGDEWRTAIAPLLQRVSREAIDMTHARLAGPARLPLTSSLGRVFDAVAFLLGIADENHHEAEAAMALEATARRAKSAEPLTYRIVGGEDGLNTPLELDVRPMIAQIAAAGHTHGDVAVLARAFHETIAAGLADMAARIAAKHRINRVVLSGGCLANRLLLGSLTTRLRASGLQAYTHRLVPTGDGGVSLGQAVCAASNTGDNYVPGSTRKTG